MSNSYFVYILASERNGTLYVGMTSNLEQRISQHKLKIFKGFTEKYNVGVLVYYEITNSVELAIAGEKQLKKWNRVWKINLIEESNPEWIDLSRVSEPGEPAGSGLWPGSKSRVC